MAVSYSTYLGVNGSDKDFEAVKRPYELASPLNDPNGEWLQSHGVNRYRDWDELRYSIRSVTKYAGSFKNKIQVLVNGLSGTQPSKQTPQWLSHDTGGAVQVLAQDEYFEEDKKACLPTFDSLTMENQIFNTPSEVDRVRLSMPDIILSHC